MNQQEKFNIRKLFRQSLLTMLLLFGLSSCAPGMENPFEGIFDSFTGQNVEERTEQTNSDEIQELVPETDATTEPLVVEVVETPIDQLEQVLVGSQETSESEVLTVVVPEDTSQENVEIETTTETSTSSFTTTPAKQDTEIASAEDPERIIIEYTNVDFIWEDASLQSFFAAGPHALLAMRDEEEMVGIATLASDGTLSLRTADVLEHSRSADQTFVGCLDVIREHTPGASVFGGISFFESISVPGLILTPVLDVNGDGSYIPPVNYVRLTDPLLVSGTCFQLETAVESVQASFVPGWNRLLREIDWRDIARGSTVAQDSDIQKTLWSVNNNAETVVKWLYSRP